MGGRGASSGIGGRGSPDGVFPKSRKKTIETDYRYGRYGKSVLEAITDGNGNITLRYAYPEKFVQRSRNTKDVTFEVQAGVVGGESFNINWKKVKSVSGKTYAISAEAKAAGLQWDKEQQKWIRKKSR